MGDSEMEMTLSMYQSFGNDYLIYDCMKNDYELKPEDIRNICNRLTDLTKTNNAQCFATQFGKWSFPVTEIGTGTPITVFYAFAMKTNCVSNL